MGYYFAQNTTHSPCSLLSSHTPLSGIYTCTKYSQPHPNTPLFLAWTWKWAKWTAVWATWTPTGQNVWKVDKTFLKVSKKNYLSEPSWIQPAAQEVNQLNFQNHIKSLSVSESFLPPLIQNLLYLFKYQNDHFQVSEEALGPQWRSTSFQVQASSSTTAKFWTSYTFQKCQSVRRIRNSLLEHWAQMGREGCNTLKFYRTNFFRAKWALNEFWRNFQQVSEIFASLSQTESDQEVYNYVY